MGHFWALNDLVLRTRTTIELAARDEFRLQTLNLK